MKETITYLKSFVTDKDVASVTPSSVYCIKKLSRHINFDTAKIIVEYGGGTGVFTKHFLENLGADARIFVFETNDKFVEKLNEIKDERLTVFHESVEHVNACLPKELHGNVDHVVSGVPFSFFDWDFKVDLLNKTKAVLRPEGSFLAYQTSGHLKDPLDATFGNYNTDFVLRNIPPMYIYQAVKKLQGPKKGSEPVRPAP